MTRFMRIPFTCLLVAASVLVASHPGIAQQTTGSLPEVVVAAFADPPPDPAKVAPIDVSKQSIENEQAALQSATLPEPQKLECEARLNKALGWLQTAEEAGNRRTAIESQTKAIPEAVARLRASLSVPPPTIEIRLPTDATVVQLESRLTELKQQAESVEADFQSEKKEADTRATRLQEVAKELIEVQKRVTAAQGQVPVDMPTDIEGRSKWFEQATKLNANLQQMERLRAERRYLEAASELLPLERDQAERGSKAKQKLLASWQKAVESWRKSESLRQAETARRNAENSHPALRSLAEQNAAIAEERIVTASGIAKIATSVNKLKTVSTTLKEEFEDLRQKVAYAGATSSTGVLLRKKRSELPTDAEFAERESFVNREMPRAHLQVMERKKLQAELSDPAEAASNMLGQLDELVSQFGKDQVVQVLTALLTDRRELLDKGIPDQETYLEKLNELDLANQALRAEVKTFREYLDQRVLWMRSGETLQPKDIRQAAHGLLTLANPTRWTEVARVACGDLVRRPTLGLAVLALFALIIIFRARLLSVQRRLCQPPLEGQPASFNDHATAFAITFLIAARWPVVLLAFGYRLTMAAGNTAWTQSVGAACLATVILVWGCELLHEIARPEGIGESMFGWPKAATKSIRRTLKITLLIGTPFIAMLQLARFGELAELESLHRVLFIGTISLFVIQLGMILRPSGQLMRSISERSPTATVYRMRHLIWLSTTAAPAGFALLSVLGFHYSAYQLSGRLAETGAAIVGIIFVYALALSWLDVKAYNRSLLNTGHDESPDDAADMQLESPLADTDVIVQPEPINTIMPTDSADGEFRDLLHNAAIATMICGGWFIWADVLPALHILDHIELWQNIETVAGTVTSADGTETVRLNEHAVPTTLTDVLTALLVCVGTILIGRRLPGFLELTLLDRLPLDQGGRQAIAILVRYTATLAGLLFACQIIRLSWSSVQWLAAAMTVGLGFGLQEIFANLVSGIIILFERPIRSGDLVTVGDLTGNVTRMQMRATTITDFDRREMIVPNKKFITDNVINWTLSDPISRVVLPVGVAYGSNIKQVERILLKIAKDCTFVMQEPAATTLFKGFGDSTLDMELRVFIPKRDVYVDVVNQINGAIDREFTKAGIQIAFPQRDLHIKSVESLAALLPRKQTAKAA